MPYWRLFYHIVWGTDHHQPLMQGEIAASLHRYIADKGRQLGAQVFEVGGTEDHIHVAASVPPSLALSEFVRQLKGSSSHFANSQLTLPARFEWQTEYGVVSLDGKQLERVIQYIKNQRQHHGNLTTIAILERLAPETQSL